MPAFFIDRPVFAWVIALVVMLAGGSRWSSLPVAQYPTVALRLFRSLPATRGRGRCHRSGHGDPGD